MSASFLKILKLLLPSKYKPFQKWNQSQNLIFNYILLDKNFTSLKKKKKRKEA
jgi:hypothetical protein